MVALTVTLLLGLCIGVLVNVCQPPRESYAWMYTAILGILGAFWASYAGYALGLYSEQSHLSWLAAGLGALLMALFYQRISSSLQPKA